MNATPAGNRDAARRVLTCLTRQAGWRGETISLERSGVDVARHLAQRLSD
jgi:malonate decarboxylase epsilon subunit